MAIQINTDISDFPTAPDSSTDNEVVFNTKADAWVGHMDKYVTEVNTWASEANAMADEFDITAGGLNGMVKRSGDTMTGNLDVPTISHIGKTFKVEELSTLGGKNKIWRVSGAADNLEYTNNKGYPIMISLSASSTVTGSVGSRIIIYVGGEEIGRILSNVSDGSQQSFTFIVPDGSTWKFVRSVASSSGFTAMELS